MLGAVTAVSALPSLVDAGRKAWAGVKAVKSTAQTVQKFRRAPAEMHFTFQLCSCLLDQSSHSSSSLRGSFLR